MKDLAIVYDQVVDTRQSLAEAVWDATQRFVSAECCVAAAERLVSAVSEQCGAARAAHAAAARAREAYESGAQGGVLSWRLRCLRQVEQQLEGLVATCDAHLADVNDQYVEAVESRDAQSGAIAKALADKNESMKAGLDRYRRSVSCTIAELSKLSAEPTKDDLKEIRCAIRREDWEDLPAYHGSGGRFRRDCVHCGSELPAGRKSYCSIDCHRMHLEAYGSDVKASRRG